MINLNSLTKLFAAAACIVACSTVNAQEAVTLQEDGSLVGKAFVAATSEAAADAKMTLPQEGQVISTVNADDQGNFSFQNIEPGSYEVLGAADPYVGQASYEVAPFAAGGCSSCSMGLVSEPTEVAYSTCGSAPAQSFSASPCGGGCGCGGGGGFFGGGGGGLFSSPLVRLGAIGGIIAIATSDDDDDASPDN
jgi:hypothetical protein